MNVDFLLGYLAYYLILILVFIFYSSYFDGVIAYYDKSKRNYLSGRDISGSFFIRQRIWVRQLNYIFNEEEKDNAEINKHKKRLRRLYILIFISTFVLFFLAGTTQI